MNFNLPNLIQTALPEESRNKNIAILNDNWTGTMNHNDPGFLSDDFPRNAPKLYITAESDDFDPQILLDWRNEGFAVEYLPMGLGGAKYRSTLRTLHRKRKLDPCETFGIIAFGDAASLCLEHFHVLDNNPELKLSCLVAYYPTRIPDPDTKFPSAIRVLAHLPVGEIRVIKQSQMVGIQGKKRLIKRTIDRGVGVGGSLPGGYARYAYEAEPGFAERDLDEFDRIAADLAWSRSLAIARRAFRVDAPGRVEGIAEANSQGRFYARNLQQTMETYTEQLSAHVTHVPTLSGGVGLDDLAEFYERYFLQSNPPSMDITLLSRTVGVDRVVDEMYVYFKHTQEMPWILPGVPPTGKRVEITLVSIVTVRGGRLYHEHVYWDQASVLVQVGLLNPNVIPKKGKEQGVVYLPVIGKKAARRMYYGGSDDEDGEADNELIYAWEGDSDDDESGEEEEEEEEEEDYDEGESYDEEEEEDHIEEIKRVDLAVERKLPVRSKPAPKQSQTNGGYKPTKSQPLQERGRTTSREDFDKSQKKALEKKQVEEQAEEPVGKIEQKEKQGEKQDEVHPVEGVEDVDENQQETEEDVKNVNGGAQTLGLGEKQQEQAEDHDDGEDEGEKAAAGGEQNGLAEQPKKKKKKKNKKKKNGGVAAENAGQV